MRDNQKSHNISTPAYQLGVRINAKYVIHDFVASQKFHKVLHDEMITRDFTTLHKLFPDSDEFILHSFHTMHSELHTAIHNMLLQYIEFIGIMYNPGIVVDRSVLREID